MKSKIEKLVELVNPATQVKSLKRLNGGDLSHIGDAIINGREILTDDELCPLEFLSFQGQASRYTIRQEMRSLNGYEYPAPETEAPEVGTPYYVPCIDGSILSKIWHGIRFDLNRLSLRIVHLSEENAIAHAEAIIWAGGGEI